jgi:uroporphyrinogen-III synthase
MPETGLPPRDVHPPRVLITRPLAQAQPDIGKLAAAGLDADAVPLLAIEPLPDQRAITQAWADLPRYALVMFVSPNAVLHFFAVRPSLAPAFVLWPEGLRAAATGPGTVAALIEAGLAAGQCLSSNGPRYDSQALWDEVLQHQPWQGAQVLIVRGNGGRDELADRLTDAGAQITFVQSYSRALPVWTAAQRAAAQAAVDSPQSHLWHFSSSEAVKHLPTLLPQAQWGISRAVATHPRIAAAARDIGFGVVDEIDVPLAALMAYVKGPSR